MTIAEILLARLNTSRVDFVGIGDSNQLLSGAGWDHGFQFALSKQFTMWATGLISANENDGNGAGVGYRYSWLFGNVLSSTGAPAELDVYVDATDIRNYGFR